MSSPSLFDTIAPAEPLTRLFFALFPDAGECATLAERADALRVHFPRARWVAPQKYHLTFHYLGESAGPRPDWIQCARAAGSAWRAEALPIVLDELRLLGNPRRPALALCASRVDARVEQHWRDLREALLRAGFKQARHGAFLPHATLAYLEPAALPSAPPPVTLLARECVLVQSVAGQEEYQRLQAWRLGA